MTKYFILFFTCVSLVFGQSQQDTIMTKKPTKLEKLYRAEATKINRLIHTDLEVTPDFQKCYLYGKATITLTPYFYPTDSLTLDAKGMNINEIDIVENGKKSKLNFYYDSMQLFIKLNKTYLKNEPYTIFIDYVAKPNELHLKGSRAISQAKGLYFINPLGTEKNKPTQIWTQGETESNSCWFPTIDKPNQKMTEKIAITIPSKFVTLSNGLLIQQIQENDSTRTDIWNMDLPHAPYLVFMGIGEYAIVKDTYKNKEVSYYVEKPYESVARKIFGLTPEMMGCYSNLLGVDFPWQKYSQIVGRNFVSGAMENTTATLHKDAAQQSERELIDGNKWESVIAHELFHQWFGDLVTCESWSNITLNESFATYGEYLWNEYKYGKEKADAMLLSFKNSYMHGGKNSRGKNLVRYYYKDKEDVFDNVSYPKGAFILHMLRKYLGDSAFFKGLNLYLTNNKFKSAEVAQLRIAFEQICGQDLHWFFDEWYFNNGHPTLNIKDSLNLTDKKLFLLFNQSQKEHLFKIPVNIWVFDQNKHIEKYLYWVSNINDTFSMSFKEAPLFYIVDPERIILSDFNEYKKSKSDYLFQIKNIPFYLSKKDAIEKIMPLIDSNTIASKDSTFGILFNDFVQSGSEEIKEIYLSSFEKRKMAINKKQEQYLINLILNKNNTSNIRILGAIYLHRLDFKKYKPIFEKIRSDSSLKLSTVADFLLLSRKK